MWGKLKKVVQIAFFPPKIEKTGTENHQKPRELRAPEASHGGRPRQVHVSPSRLFRRGKYAGVWGKLGEIIQIAFFPPKIEKTGSENHHVGGVLCGVCPAAATTV